MIKVITDACMLTLRVCDKKKSVQTTDARLYVCDLRCFFFYIAPLNLRFPPPVVIFSRLDPSLVHSPRAAAARRKCLYVAPAVEFHIFRECALASYACICCTQALAERNHACGCADVCSVGMHAIY